MTNNYAPVAVFAYKRAEHLKNTLNSLNKSPLAKGTDLFIFCDHWKNDKDKESVIETYKVVDEFSTNNNFKKIYLKKAEVNKGLAKSVIDGVTEIINQYGKIIVVEDDLITAPNFLSFMNDALTFYQKDERIWAVSGYTFFMRALKKYPYDVYFSDRCCSWGWATWKDRWNKTDWGMQDYDNFICDRKKIKAFARWGEDMPYLLKLQKEKKIDSWAIRWCYSAFVNGALTVYPSKSLVTNCGLDGSGTHSFKPTKGFESYYFEDANCSAFISPFVCDKIRKQYSLRYPRSFLKRIERKILQFLKLY